MFNTLNVFVYFKILKLTELNTTLVYKFADFISAKSENKKKSLADCVVVLRRGVVWDWARPRPSRSIVIPAPLLFLAGKKEGKKGKGRGVGLAGDGGGAGVPGGAGRDAAGARGVVRSARWPVPAEAVAPAHPQARPVPRPRRRPGPSVSLIPPMKILLFVPLLVVSRRAVWPD